MTYKSGAMIVLFAKAWAGYKQKLAIRVQEDIYLLHNFLHSINRFYS